jgi:uncharacterized protein
MRKAIAFLLLILAPAAGWAEHAPGEPNRLSGATSAYLQQHARSPVDWHAWGPEAIARARRENKPIFLSIGYSACYWCHVANWTLYEDPEVARLMNRWFVNVKVDCDERPDIDRIYLRATRLMTGSAGWPNNLFLTPDLKPFFAGSYWPRHDDDAGRPGFVTVMKRIHEEWTRDERGAREKSERVAAVLRSETVAATGVRTAPEQWRRAARDALLGQADSERGGFRSPGGAKFPQAPALELLLAEGARDAAARAFVTTTLDAMASGGIHDHLGGGFHRYALDADWTIPHFEKMLVDNVQLLALYARAYQATGRRLYRDVAQGTADFLLRELAAPGGGFHVSLDAAASRKEGATYLWNAEEIEGILDPGGARRFFAAYELKIVAVPGEDPLGGERRVLRVRRPVAETLARTGFADLDALFAGLARERGRLLEVRQRRAQPARDEKILTGANGLAIEAFAVAAAVLPEPRHLEVARATAERIWRVAYEPATGKLARQLAAGRAEGEGFLEDYALLARGFLALHEASGDARWRTRAAALADAILRLFLRPDGRLASTRSDLDLFVSADEHEDYVHPSGPSATLDVLRRLGEPRFSAAAERIMIALASRVAARPERWPALAAVAPVAVPSPRQALESAAPKDVVPSGQEWPTSANRVKARATVRTGGREDYLRVELVILRGWHVNANPATYPYLIPTGLSVEGATPLRMSYPRPARFAPRFVPAAIDVYKGRVTIEADFQKGTLARRDGQEARLTVQACSDTVCLPPDTIAIPINLVGPPAASRRQ